MRRKHGISETTFYKWEAKYGGLEVSEARRLKGLEDENRRLKKLLAEAMLDVAALKEVLAKTADACGAQGGGAATGSRIGAVAAARLQADRDRPQDGSPTCLAGRSGGAWPTA